MNTKKVIGYILVAIGFILLIITSSPFQTYLAQVPFLSQQPTMYLMIAGAVVIIVGVFFLMGKQQKKEREVPIFKGKDVVGYRVTK